MKVVMSMSMFIYGKNPAIEVLKSGRGILRAFVVEGDYSTFEKELIQRNIEIQKLDKKTFERQFSSNAQGIALEVEDYRLWTLEEGLSDIDMSSNPMILMLDEIEDPHNLGAIIRTAEGAGVGAIILPKHHSAKITPTVVKVSVGAIEYVKLIEVTNLVQTIEKLKAQGFWIVGSSLDATEDHTAIYIDRPICLIIGNEGSGMKRLVKEHTDLLVKIPMVGKTNSLNASVSAGILIFDWINRKRG